MTIRGQPITPDYLKTVCIRLNTFQLPASTASITLPHPQHSALAQNGEMTASNTSRPVAMVPLDYDRVRHDLLSLTDRNTAVLLQVAPPLSLNTELNCYFVHLLSSNSCQTLF